MAIAKSSSVSIEDFLHSDPPNVPGGTLDDASQVHDCMESAIDYYHDQLPANIENIITTKWGILPETIEEKRIGWTGDGNGLVDHLEQAGFDRLTIIRSGLASNTALRHVLYCTPSECSHSYEEDHPFNRLATQRESGDITTEAIDIEAVYTFALENEEDHYISDPRHNRIVFPYKDYEGNYRYTISRETHLTDDWYSGKYVKQTVKKPWVNSDAVWEPIYGAETVQDGKPLILTEGITDAIMAHQAGFPCLTQARLTFDKFEDTLNLASRASRVVVIFDNETTRNGPISALDTAFDLKDAGIDTLVGTIPLDGRDKIDLAEYLSANQPEALVNEVIRHSVGPAKHPIYGELSEKKRRQINNDLDDPSESASEYSSDTSGGPKSSSGDRSAIYELSIGDVISESVGYRGDHPIQHHGDSHSNYFAVYKENGEVRARDFKVGRSGSDGTDYNALMWLAVESGARHPRNPNGPFSDEELWEIWTHAKEVGHIESDDKAPTAALHHIATKHDLAETPIEKGDALPPTVYNRVLLTMREFYNVDPGRRLASSGPQSLDEAAIDPSA